MHTHAPHAVQGGQRGDHRGRGLPAIGAPRLTVRLRKKRAEKPLAGRADEDRDSGADELWQRPQQRPIVFCGLGESQTGVDDQIRRIDTGRHGGVDAGQQFVADLGDDIAVGRYVVRLGAAHRSPMHKHPRHFRVGEQACHIGIGPPAGTSLTIWAPFSSAARATSACIVSMLTLIPFPASSLTTGSTRAISTRPSMRVAPGRVDCTADVDDRGTVGSKRHTMRDGRCPAGSRKNPPSENESSVTFTTPITCARGGLTCAR